MERLRIRVTKRDVDEAQRYELDPLVCALARVTGTLWRVSECGTALEVVPPYHVFLLDRKTHQLWRAYRDQPSMPALDFVAICYPLRSGNNV
jgi:hypothetical protein